ncbi:MAG: hypothetical protein HRT45_12350 [Bdellovibrionales bacterium]|nr:hypothetical protein [Bdellovibrionales bacterium]
MADPTPPSFSNCSQQAAIEELDERYRPPAYFLENGELRFWEDQTGFVYHTRELEGVNRILDVTWPYGRYRIDYMTNSNGVPLRIRTRQTASIGFDNLVIYDYDPETGECNESQIVKFALNNQGVTVYDRQICENIRPFLDQMSLSEFASCTSSINGIQTALMTRAAALEYPFGAEGVYNHMFNNL